MKRELFQNEEAELKELFLRLEKEKNAGIPSIPEGLMPEHIERLLKQKGKKRAVGKAAWRGGFAVVAAAAALALILPAYPARKQDNASPERAGVTSADQNTAGSMSGAGDGGRAESALLDTIYVTEEAQLEESTELEEILGETGRERWDSRRSKRAKRPEWYRQKD